MNILSQTDKKPHISLKKSIDEKKITLADELVKKATKPILFKNINSVNRNSTAVNIKNNKLLKRDISGVSPSLTNKTNDNN